MPHELDQSSFESFDGERYKLRLNSTWSTDMAMRYIYRWPNPDDFSLLKSSVPDLDAQLGKAGEKLRRTIRVQDPTSPVRYSNYSFITRKTGANWSWICASVELVAEDEKGLFKLTEAHKIPRPSHLAHLN